METADEPKLRIGGGLSAILDSRARARALNAPPRLFQLAYVNTIRDIRAPPSSLSLSLVSIRSFDKNFIHRVQDLITRPILKFNFRETHQSAHLPLKSGNISSTGYSSFLFVYRFSWSCSFD